MPRAPRVNPASRIGSPKVNASDGHEYPDGSVASLLDMTVYDIVASQPLPQFDPSLTIKRHVVPHRWIPSVNAFLKRYAVAIRVAYAMGLVCRTVTAMVPAQIAQWIAVVALPFQVPAVLNVVFQFRVSFVKLLLRTYDFWYYLAMNTVWASCLMWYFGDLRIAIVPLMWVDVQNATLLDAFLQDFRVIVSATWIWCVGLFGVMVAVSLDVVDTNDTLLVTRRRTITVKEVLLNSIATVFILVVRIVYRKRTSMLNQRKCAATTRTVESITLTWPLELQQRVRARATSSGRSWQSQRPFFQPTKLQLELTLHAMPLKASHVILSDALFALEHLSGMRWPIRMIGCAGFVAVPIVFGMPDEKTELRLGAAVVAIACTTMYCSILVCYYQRRLFKLLVLSFDFAFISLQLTIVHVCVADMFRWQLVPTLAVASAWLWLHVVMTLDALTPTMRRVLGFYSWFRVPTLLLALVAAVTMWLEVSVWDSQKLLDRCFLDVTLGGRRIQLHVVPCLLSRLLTVSLWCVRMLYRIMTRTSDHELLFIRSHVEFDALFHQRKRSRSMMRSGSTPTPASTPMPLAPVIISPIPFLQKGPTDGAMELWLRPE